MALLGTAVGIATGAILQPAALGCVPRRASGAKG